MATRRKLPRAILIAGPTASGKSALALALAQRLDGVIVNADSMQVYRALCILTARPSRADLERAPHHLYGHIEARETYSVARWLSELKPLIHHSSRIPIIVGGTGLYFEALTKGIADIPSIPAPVRAEIRALRERDGARGLYQALQNSDPAMARQLSPGDAQRLARALEVIRATGRSLGAWQDDGAAEALLPLDETAAFVLAPPREALYAAIDQRFVRMMAEGALNEVRALQDDPPPITSSLRKALGVEPLQAALDGRLSLAEAVAAAQRSSRRYAKRQLTWFRGKFITWNWITEQYSNPLIDDIFPLIIETG